MKKYLVILAGLLGILLLIVAWIYWSTPADKLPIYFPGYSAGITTIHFKHGLAALVAALGLFIFVWFGSAKKAR